MSKLKHKNVSATSSESVFQPIDFNIRIESEDELRLLWACFNASRTSILEHGSSIFKKEHKGDTYKYWTVLNQAAYELGITSSKSSTFISKGE